MSNKKDKAKGRKNALKEFLIGAAVAAVGGVASFMSYNAVANSRTGGTYTVYTGLIALGVVYAIKGLWGIIFPLGLRGNKTNEPSEAVVTDDTKEAEVVKETEE